MKYVRYILSVFFVVVFFGSVSLADGAYTTQEVEDSFLQFVSDTYNMTIPFDGQYGQQNKTRLDEVLNLWISEPENKLITYIDMNDYLYFGVVTSYSISINQVTYNYDIINSYRPSLGTIVNPGYRGNLTDTFAGDSFRDLGTLSEFMNPIDYDNTIYDPMIFSPKYNITNTIHNSMKTVELSYTRMSDDNYYNDNRTYYLYLKYYLYSPKDVYVDYNHYTPNAYYKSQPIVVFDYQDMHENVGYWTIDLNDYKGDAVDDFIDYCMEHVTFDFKLGMSSGKMTQRTLDYIDIVERGFPFFVNNIEIWAQVFCVEDGKIYTSNWTIWNSTRLSQYVGVTPVADEQPASGIKNNENPNSEIAQNPDSDTYNPIGEQTGTDQQNGTQVVINNNTPNYPDYPTAVSYNHDNVLVQFIQTAAYLPQLFSGYSSFLTSAFAFIPSGIWTIIGMGFLSSIVIMIVKVL